MISGFRYRHDELFRRAPVLGLLVDDFVGEVPGQNRRTQSGECSSSQPTGRIGM
jgi:hypothetical protein